MIIHFLFSVAKATLQSQMSVRLSVCLSVTEIPQPLRIALIDHRAYQPSSLSTIEPFYHQAYRPSSLSTIKPIDHQAYQPSSPLTIKPINLSSSLMTFKPFDLFPSNQHQRYIIPHPPY